MSIISLGLWKNYALQRLKAVLIVPRIGFPLNILFVESDTTGGGSFESL